MDRVDWDHIRRHKYATVSPPSDWPRGIRPISLEGTGLLGIDARGRLYWDGEYIRTDVVLSRWQNFGAAVVVFSSFLSAMAAIALVVIELLRLPPSAP